ncbi:MAG TPA: TetR/AcrR family transcriptional regulator [Acidimicrobiales bacterium]|nr:TetR/AcrR family transcriptional regulator [Acidimicrobiales bacterium]
MKMQEAPTPPEPTAEPTTTRELILDAAVELFAQRGYHATSMREIAAAVPLRAAGIYYWYDNKAAILLQLERSFLDELSEAVEKAIARQKTPASKLAAAVREHVLFHGLYPRAAFVTDSELRALSGDDREEIQHKRDTYQTMFVRMIQDGVDAGVFKTSDVKIASYAILLECTGVAIWFDAAGSRSIEEVANIHIELVLGSLFAPRAAITKAIRDTNSHVR